MEKVLDVLFCEDATIETILELHECGFCFNVNDGQITEVTC